MLKLERATEATCRLLIFFLLLFSPQTKFEFASLVHDFRMSLLMEFEAKLCSNLA